MRSERSSSAKLLLVVLLVCAELVHGVLCALAPRKPAKPPKSKGYTKARHHTTRSHNSHNATRERNECKVTHSIMGRACNT